MKKIIVAIISLLIASCNQDLEKNSSGKKNENNTLPIGVQVYVTSINSELYERARSRPSCKIIDVTDEWIITENEAWKIYISRRNDLAIVVHVSDVKKINSNPAASPGSR